MTLKLEFYRGHILRFIIYNTVTTKSLLEKHTHSCLIFTKKNKLHKLYGKGLKEEEKGA